MLEPLSPLSVHVSRFLCCSFVAAFPNVERWYKEITSRPAFHVRTAQPEHHLEGQEEGRAAQAPRSR
jgi:glutathione S-transferase